MLENYEDKYLIPKWPSPWYFFDIFLSNAFSFNYWYNHLTGDFLPPALHILAFKIGRRQWGITPLVIAGSLLLPGILTSGDLANSIIEIFSGFWEWLWDLILSIGVSF